jgi:hypothetical protein
MAAEFTICAGTVGSGIWYSRDSGERWKRAKMELPFFSKAGDVQVRSLAVSPHDPHLAYAGSEVGLYRSADKCELGIGGITDEGDANLVGGR